MKWQGDTEMQERNLQNGEDKAEEAKPKKTMRDRRKGERGKQGERKLEAVKEGGRESYVKKARQP